MRIYIVLLLQLAIVAFTYEKKMKLRPIFWPKKQETIASEGN